VIGNDKLEQLSIHPLTKIIPHMIVVLLA